MFTIVKTLVLTLVFLTPLFTISLPNVIPPGLRTVNASDAQSSPYAETSHAEYYSINNVSSWILTSQSNTVSLNYTSNNVMITGTFPLGGGSSTVVMSNNFDNNYVNLTQYPILYVHLIASQDIIYGLRFYNRDSVTNLVLPLSNNNDVLNQRQGTGKSEEIQVNLVHIIEQNIGRNVPILNGVNVYVTRNPSTQSSSPFSLQILKFEFLNYPFTNATGAGSYRGLYVELNSPPKKPSSYSLQGVQFTVSLNASTGTHYRIYLIQGLTVHPGDFYIYNNTDPVTHTIGIGSSWKSFSDNLPVGSNAIVIVASSGTIYNFNITNAAWDYVTYTTETTSPPARHWAPFVNTLFLYVLLPGSIAILLYQPMKNHWKKNRI